MILITRFRLGTIDKKITGYLKQSKWLSTYRMSDPDNTHINTVDRSEQWVREVERFADTVWSEKGYRRILEAADIDHEAIVDIFLIMTITTLPNPVFRTGPSIFSNTLVGSAMYQEIDKQLAQFLPVWRENKDLSMRSLHNAIGTFAFHLKTAHDLAYGSMTLEQTLS